MKFWDSSAVVPLLTQEISSKNVSALFRNDPSIMAWWATVIECTSAITRREREGALVAFGVEEALRRLRRLQSGWQEIQPTDALRDLAVRLLRVHSLNAADSLQLAAAIHTSENRPSSLDFVCLDAKLAAAAEREGFNVLSG